MADCSAALCSLWLFTACSALCLTYKVITVEHRAATHTQRDTVHANRSAEYKTGKEWEKTVGNWWTILFFSALHVEKEDWNNTEVEWWSAQPLLMHITSSCSWFKAPHNLNAVAPIHSVCFSDCDAPQGCHPQPLAAWAVMDRLGITGTLNDLNNNFDSKWWFIASILSFSGLENVFCFKLNFLIS